ncbi:MAG: outer membrane beta-barrel protein [bacterium]
MKKFFLVLLAFSIFFPVVSKAGDHALGVGFQYFYTLKEISDDLEESVSSAFKRDGLGINFSYCYKPNKHLGVSGELQFYPDGYLDAKSAVSPRLLLLLGQSFYGGVGIGWNNVKWRDETKDLHISGDWTKSFYLLRAGLEFPILAEHLRLNFHANYEFNYWNDVKEFDSDILTFGAGIKIVF